MRDRVGLTGKSTRSYKMVGIREMTDKRPGTSEKCGGQEDLLTISGKSQVKFNDGVRRNGLSGVGYSS